MIIYLGLVSIIVLGLLARNSKTIFWVLYITMVIVGCFNTFNADTDNYLHLYNYIYRFDNYLLITSIEHGFSFILCFCKLILHLDYYQATGLIVFIGLTSITITIKKYAKYPTMVLALYFISPFFPCDIIQMRNLLCEAVVLNAILRLMNCLSSNSKKEILIYILKIIFASFFHTLSLFYLLLILAYFIRDYKKYRLTISIMAISIGAIPYVLSLLPFISVNKIHRYLSNASIYANYRDFIFAFVILFQILLARNIYIFAENSDDRRLINESIYAYRIHLMMIIPTILMLLYSSVFYRIPRNILVIDYIMLSNSWYHFTPARRRTYLCLYIGIGLIWSVVNVLSQWNVLLQNNSIIGYLW